MYGSHSVLEFWLIDLDDNLVTVYREPTPTGLRQRPSRPKGRECDDAGVSGQGIPGR